MTPLSRDLHPSNGRRAPKDEVVVSVARVAEGAAENGVLVEDQTSPPEGDPPAEE